MEVSTLEYKNDNNEPVMQFHNHFADHSKQDTATTNANMDVLFMELFDEGIDPR